MSDRVHRFASIDSVDSIPAADPYPAAPVSLTIDEDGSAFLNTAQQFECYGEDCSISVRFDGQPAQAVRASDQHLDPPSLSLQDYYGESNDEYLRLPGFVSKVKRSNKLLIQVPVFRQGPQVVTFDLSGYDEAKLKAAAPAG